MDPNQESRLHLDRLAKKLPSLNTQNIPNGLADWQIEALQAFTVANPLLVTDDDNMSRKYYRSLLVDTFGLRIIETWDPDEALRIARTQPISLVISCIIKITPMNGLELIEQLREIPQSHFLPVLLISGSAHVHELATQAGADAHLTKPCHPNEILQEIWLLLRERIL